MKPELNLESIFENTTFAEHLMILQDELADLAEQLAHLESLVEVNLQCIQSFNNIY